MPLTPTCNSPLSYFDYMHSLWSDYKAVKVVLKNVAFRSLGYSFWEGEIRKLYAEVKTVLLKETNIYHNITACTRTRSLKGAGDRLPIFPQCFSEQQNFRDSLPCSGL